MPSLLAAGVDASEYADVDDGAILDGYMLTTLLVEAVIIQIDLKNDCRARDVIDLPDHLEYIKYVF